jgi:hypothetical protein
MVNMSNAVNDQFTRIKGKYMGPFDIAYIDEYFSGQSERGARFSIHIE